MRIRISRTILLFLFLLDLVLAKHHHHHRRHHHKREHHNHHKSELHNHHHHHKKHHHQHQKKDHRQHQKKESKSSIEKPIILKVGYWGQNPTKETKKFSEYCGRNIDDQDIYNIVILAFIAKTNPMSINLWPHLYVDDNNQKTVDDGLLSANEIRNCQAKGAKVLVSIGGATGVLPQSGTDWAALAGSVWDQFFSGKGTSLLGGVILDGVDLDIENSPTPGISSFIKAIKAKGDIIISGAPQCPELSTEAVATPYMAEAITSNSTDHLFDFLNVQFYNNGPCNAGYPDLNATGGFLYFYDKWANWGRPRGTKILVGFQAAAGSNGYAMPDRVQEIVDMKKGSDSNFGGVMVWDIATAEKSGFAPKLV